MRKLKFIWIDDDPERKGTAETLGEALKVKMEFFQVDVHVDNYFTEIVLKSEPDLLIMDHNLQDSDSGIFKKGSTATAYLREHWPDCPMICVTGENINDIDSQQRAIYEDLFTAVDISDHYSQILIIAKSYKALKENRPSNPEELLLHIKVPEIDQQKLSTIIPTSIKENFEDRSLLFEISRWVRQTLLGSPGFLYDRIRTATLLGLNLDGFAIVEQKFKRAKYIGIFNDPNKPYWWKSEILSILSDLVKKNGLSWEKGRFLKGLTAEHFSKCFRSNEDFPETVAFTDQSKDSEEHPMKIKYTQLHPDFERLLYFDDILIMKPAE